MANAPFSDVDQTMENNLLRARSTPAEAPSMPPVTYHLKVLSDGADGGRRTVLFQRIAGDGSIEISAETCAPNLLADLPEFLDAALALQKAISASPGPAARPSPSALPRFTEESQRMRLLTGRERAGSAARASERAALLREARLARDASCEALRKVIEPRRRAMLDALVSAGDTDLAIATSLEEIAAIIEERWADPGEAIALAMFDLDADYAAALLQKAAELRALASGEATKKRKRTRKRGDLRLLGMAYRALGADAFVAVPRRTMAAMLEGKGRRKGRARS